MCADNEGLSEDSSDKNFANNGKNSNNSSNSKESKEVRTSFTDKELEDALLGFEKEFNDEQKHDSVDDVVNKIEQANFEEDLEGLLGKKAKCALFLTVMEPGELLAAFCKMAGIRAKCFSDENGGVAVLCDLDEDNPEKSVKRFTEYFRGIPAILMVNRANKIDAKVYEYKKEVQDAIPPMVLTMSARCVEDLMICYATVEDLKESGIEVTYTDDLSDEQAKEIFYKYGKKM
ncbi:hypothetical protein HMPREF9435_1147 [Gardnerella vaginalis 315-A]|uniref:hypothetical protein n=1 Tax=Gardnerella vaginalis TaxID=2702 RepID=UPI00020D74DD|nr:hypothetical protein [Gardnerella vaginalis]EGL14407.1 hypothetical protein HMPREF9435_1147 [Gardnerella vaginalis 315-A]